MLALKRGCPGVRMEAERKQRQEGYGSSIINKGMHRALIYWVEREAPV